MPADTSKDNYAQVNQRLEQWAEWSARLEANGLGFPRRVHWISNHRRGSNNDGLPPMMVTDEKALEVECLVNELPSAIRDIVILEYLRGGSQTSKHKRAGCSNKTYDNRLQTAYKFIQLRLFG